MKNQICSIEMCTGCAACANICPKNAINMTVDSKGFLRPFVFVDKCVNCNLCQKTCPQNKNATMNDGEIYAAVSKNDTIRKKSTSGGAFSSLASYILDNNGVVFGAELTDDLRVAHTSIERFDDIYKLRGSKYIQSDIGNTYREAKKYLSDNRLVLFSGTPCQISGLKEYLGKEYDNLITIDILCHGVPSPLVFEKFINNIINRFFITRNWRCRNNYTVVFSKCNFFKFVCRHSC